jgi:hypothetical protein
VVGANNCVMTHRPPKTQNDSLAYSLGQFFGHIVKAIKTDVGARGDARSLRARAGASDPAGASLTTRVVRQTTEERVVETAQGPKTLRRTVVDEVVE